jgi:hypothetical protein
MLGGVIVTSLAYTFDRHVEDDSQISRRQYIFNEKIDYNKTDIKDEIVLILS